MTDSGLNLWINKGATAFIAVVLFSIIARAVSLAAEPAKHVVLIEGLSFVLPDKDIRAGDRITWVNKDIVPHTVTATDGAWDSGDLASGQSWTLVVEAPGPLDFFCAYHPVMTGQVTVRKRWGN